MLMSELVLSLIMDASVAVLLSVTIFFCARLNKRVQVLQDSKSELAQLIYQFDESTKQATVSIQEIHKASKKINENMQLKLDKANYLADDLAFMIERANKTADRIEQQLNSGRTVTSAARTAEVREEVRRSTTGGREERGTERPSAQKAESLREERPVDPSPRRERAAPRTEPARNTPAAAPAAKEGTKAAGIEAMMERISELRSGHQQANRPQRPMARLRTSSEQDLAQALKDTKE